MKKNFFSLFLVTLLALGILTGCSSSSGGSTGGTYQPSVSGSLSIKFLGASWYRSGNYIYQSYSAEVTNNHPTKAAQFGQVTVTLKDADGKIIKSDTTYIGTIAAGDTIRYSDIIMFQGGEPSTISLSVSTADYSFVDNSNAIPSSKLSVSNINYISGDYYSRITGEVHNSSSKDSSMTRVSVIFMKDGKVVGGTFDYVFNLNHGTSTSFEILVNNSVPFDSYQVVATPWF